MRTAQRFALNSLSSRQRLLCSFPLNRRKLRLFGPSMCRYSCSKTQLDKTGGNLFLFLRTAQLRYHHHITALSLPSPRTLAFAPHSHRPPLSPYTALLPPSHRSLAALSPSFYCRRSLSEVAPLPCSIILLLRSTRAYGVQVSFIYMQVAVHAWRYLPALQRYLSAGVVPLVKDVYGWARRHRRRCGSTDAPAA